MVAGPFISRNWPALGIWTMALIKSSVSITCSHLDSLESTLRKLKKVMLKMVLMGSS